jgi:hypothetical protein
MNLIDENYSINEFTRRFVAGQLDQYGPWGWHAGSWLGARESGPDFLFIRYEDMLLRPERELGRVLDLFGMKIEQSQIDKAVAYCSSDNLRKLEIAETDKYVSLKKSRREKFFVRKAQAGGGLKELPDSALKVIGDAWGKTMQSLGYSSSGE